MKEKRFVLGFLVVPVLCALFALPNYLVLKGGGEFASSEEVVKLLTGNKACLVGGATSIGLGTDSLKPAIYNQIKPDIVVIGTSRAMQFKERYFSVPFYNLSGIANGVDSLKILVNDILSLHKPKAMLLQADFWWFREDRVEKGMSRDGSKLPRVKKSLVQNLTLPSVWWMEGKLSGNKFWDFLNRSLADLTCPLGISANLERAGYMPDGSYFYGRRYLGNSSPQFKEALKKVDGGEANYAFGRGVSERALNKFVGIVSDLRAVGVDVAVVFPPFAPPVYKKMMTEYRKQYEFVGVAIAKLQARLSDVGNFLDPESLNTKSCEFVDGGHGGVLTYVRLLSAIKHGVLADYLDVSVVDYDLEHYKGLTVRPEELKMVFPNSAEVDFLKIGCGKQ